MANLITGRPRRRGAEYGASRALTGRERGRAGSSGPAATIGALLVACGVGALAEYFLDRPARRAPTHGARSRALRSAAARARPCAAQSISRAWPRASPIRLRMPCRASAATGATGRRRPRPEGREHRLSQGWCPQGPRERQRRQCRHLPARSAGERRPDRGARAGDPGRRRRQRREEPAPHAPRED